MTDLTNAFRDPIWQFIGAILALFALAFSIWVSFRSQKKKNLFYEVAADESLLTKGMQFSWDVKVLVNDEPIGPIRLMVIRFITGKVPIKSDDFERPLSINIGNSCRILSAEVGHASPMNLDPKLILYDHKIVILPLLLNQGDTFSINILVSDCPNIGPVDASMFDYRINGVKKINLKKERSMSAGVFLWFCLIVVLGVVTIRDSIIYYSSSNTWFLLNILLFIGLIILVGIYIGYLIGAVVAFLERTRRT